MQEIRVQSLGPEEPRGEEMAMHSSILACEIPGTQEPGGLQFRGSQRVGNDLATKNNDNKRNENRYTNGRIYI